MSKTVFVCLVAIFASACGSENSETDGSSANKGVDLPEFSACDGAKLYDNPADPAAKGPWPVGARTVTVAGLTVEVWYPAEVGSDKGKTAKTYDLRDWLPDSEKKKIPDNHSAMQTCACFADLPLDKAHGPYPAMLFIHGTAGFRTQSLKITEHWASRGFVVFAADHPNIVLTDALQLKLGSDQEGDARKILAAIRNKDAALAFLGDRVDTNQLAVSGHSAGGMALSTLGDESGVRVLIPMAARGIDPASPVTSTLVLGGEEDVTVAFAEQKKGYDATKGTKRLVGLGKGGHLSFSDLCALGGDEGILAIAKKYKITFPPGTEPLFTKLATDGCKDGQLAPKDGWAATNHATSAVLEDTLHCRQGKAAAAKTDVLASIKQAHPAVTTYTFAP